MLAHATHQVLIDVGADLQEEGEQPGPGQLCHFSQKSG